MFLNLHLRLSKFGTLFPKQTWSLDLSVDLYDIYSNKLDNDRYFKGAMRQPIQVHDFAGCEIITSVNP